MADEQVLRLGIDPGPAKRGARQYDQAIDRHVRRPSQQATRAVGGTESSFHRLKGASGLLRGALATIGIGSVTLAFRQAVGAAVEFEQAMTGVAKTVDAPASVLAQMGEDIKALSERIPLAATEIAGIAEAAGQLGIQTDNILGFTEVMAALGVSTNLSATEAATALARLANIMQTPQDQFDRMGATVVDLGNNLATTEAEIVSFATRMAGAAEIAGLTEANVLAIGGALSSVGVEAEAGGTAVQKVLLGINDAVARGNKDLQQFAQTAGMSAEGFAALWETDAASAFASFVEGLGTAGDDATIVLEDLGLNNQRLVRSFLSLANAGDLLRESVDLGTRAWEENTALTEEASKFYDTLGSDLRELANLARNVAGEFGAMFAEDIRSGGDEFARSLGAIRENMDFIGRAIRAVVTPITGLVRLAFNVGQAIGNLLEVVATQITAFVLETVNVAIRSINWLIRQANRAMEFIGRVTSARAATRFGEVGLLDSGLFAGESARAWGDFLGNSQDMLDTFEDIGNAVLNLFNPAVEDAGSAMSVASDEASSLSDQVDSVTTATDAAAASANRLAAAYRVAFGLTDRAGPNTPLPDMGIGGRGSTFSQYGGRSGGSRQGSAAELLGTAGRFVPGGFGQLLSGIGSIATAGAGAGVVLGGVSVAFEGLKRVLDVFPDRVQQARQSLSQLMEDFAIFDIDDPAEQFRRLRDEMVQQFGGVADELRGLTPENIDERIGALISQAREWMESTNPRIRESAELLLEQLIKLESLGDSALAATRGVNSFADAINAATRTLNAPSGFKVALARFNATNTAGTTTGAGTGTRPPSGPPPEPGAVNTYGDVTIQIMQRGGESGEDLAQRVVRALRDARAAGDVEAGNMLLSPAGV